MVAAGAINESSGDNVIRPFSRCGEVMVHSWGLTLLEECRYLALCCS